jgi:hypothetical protein
MGREYNLFNGGYTLKHLTSAIHTEGRESALHRGGFDRVRVESTDNLTPNFVVNDQDLVYTESTGIATSLTVRTLSCSWPEDLPARDLGWIQSDLFDLLVRYLSRYLAMLT